MPKTLGMTTCFRAHRMLDFRGLCDVHSGLQILDVGGNPANWNLVLEPIRPMVRFLEYAGDKILFLAMSDRECLFIRWLPKSWQEILVPHVTVWGQPDRIALPRRARQQAISLIRCGNWLRELVDIG